ncbi:MAG: hypothetical protein IJ928_10315 [Prevotella sp.]|nr:hypothetical protein [Prevotella sp.]
MKKIMIMAMLALGATCSFAQTDILKTIKKAKTYADAKQMVQAGISALSQEDQVKVCTKLMDLASKEFDASHDKYMTRQLNKDFDVNTTYTAAGNLIREAVNFKNLDPKGFMKYLPSLDKARQVMTEPGQEGLDENNPQKVFDYLSLYCDASSAIFADDLSKDPVLPQIAYFTCNAAQRQNLFDQAIKYAGYALNDSTYGGASMHILLTSMQKSLQTKADTLKYIEKAKSYLNKYTKGQANAVVIENLYNAYTSIGERAQGQKFIDDVIAADPNNFVALILKGQNYMTEMEYDKAIEALNKALASQPNNAVIYTYLGTCYSYKAQDETNEAKKAEFYKTAIPYYDKAKELDPEKNISNWGYNRYNAYWNLYGEDDPRTVEAGKDQ